MSGTWDTAGTNWTADGKSYTVTSIKGSGDSTGNSVLKDKYATVTTIVLPDTLTSIGEYAFFNCMRLTGELVIPDLVTSIGDSAFCNCYGFTRDLVIPDSVTSIEEYAFFYCYGFTGDLVIPDSVTSIEECAFDSCTGFDGNLILETTKSKLKSIGDGAFAYCNGFTGELVIPDSVISIGYAAFTRCEGFTGTLTFGTENSELVSIEARAFQYCYNFSGDTYVPESVTSIGASAFEGFGYSGTGVVYFPSTWSSDGNYPFGAGSGHYGTY